MLALPSCSFFPQHLSVTAFLSRGSFYLPPVKQVATRFSALSCFFLSHTSRKDSIRLWQCAGHSHSWVSANEWCCETFPQIMAMYPLKPQCKSWNLRQFWFELHCQTFLTSVTSPQCSNCQIIFKLRMKCFRGMNFFFLLPHHLPLRDGF